MQALQVVKLIIEVSCRCDCNLVTENAALKIMLKELRALKIVLGSVPTKSNSSALVDEDSNLFSLPETAEFRKIVMDLSSKQRSKDDNVMDSASINNSSADSPRV